MSRKIVGLKLLVCFGILGCAGNPQDATSPQEEGASTLPPPVASLKLGNGNTVAFYDLGTGALVAESGAAYTAPALDGTGLQAGELVGLWQKLAPEKPAPAVLVELQNRLVQENIEDSASSARASTETRRPMEAAGIASPVSMLAPALDGLVGCSNGCCDNSWLQTLPTCFYAGWDYRWYLFNYGYTWANTYDIWHMRGLVCSAVGTSAWTISVGGNTYRYNVAEATYYNWDWVAGRSIWCGGFCGSDMSSTVNSASNQHLHTYCGMVQND